MSGSLTGITITLYSRVPIHSFDTNSPLVRRRILTQAGYWPRDDDEEEDDDENHSEGGDPMDTAEDMNEDVRVVAGHVVAIGWDDDFMINRRLMMSRGFFPPAPPNEVDPTMMDPNPLRNAGIWDDMPALIPFEDEADQHLPPRPPATVAPNARLCSICATVMPSHIEMTHHEHACLKLHQEQERQHYTCIWCKQYQDLPDSRDKETLFKEHCELCFLTRADENVSKTLSESRLEEHAHRLGPSGSRLLAEVTIWEAYNESAERYTREMLEAKSSFLRGAAEQQKLSKISVPLVP